MPEKDKRTQSIFCSWRKTLKPTKEDPRKQNTHGGRLASFWEKKSRIDQTKTKEKKNHVKMVISFQKHWKLWKGTENRIVSKITTLLQPNKSAQRHRSSMQSTLLVSTQLFPDQMRCSNRRQQIVGAPNHDACRSEPHRHDHLFSANSAGHKYCEKRQTVKSQ